MTRVLAKYFSGEYADYLDIILLTAKHQDTGQKEDRWWETCTTAAEISQKIKGIKAGAGAIKGSIAPLRPGYPGMARMFTNMAA